MAGNVCEKANAEQAVQFAPFSGCRNSYLSMEWLPSAPSCTAGTVLIPLQLLDHTSDMD